MAIQPVETNPAGELNPENTTTTPLGIGGIFTGVFTEVKDYGALAIIVFTDKASATDGIEFQWSGDGVNADVIEGSSVLANTGRAFSLSVRARYFRIKYTNGGIAQTVFRLTTIYHTAGSGLISRPIDKSLTSENFAQTVRSVLAIKQTDGSFLNAVGNVSGVLQVDGSTVIQPVSGTVSSIPVPIGTHANAWNNITVVSGSNSIIIDCQFTSTITIFGNTSNNINPLRIQASQDNTNFYTITTLSIATGNWGTTLNFGARYIRLQAGQSGTITATIAGK